MKDPILRSKGGAAKGDRYVKAFGGLHYIKGNSAPYFSLTYEEGVRGRGDCESCGANHETVLKHWPELADLAALHLSDINGQPMHALENGFYHLGGTHWERPKYDVVARHFRISEQMARQLARDYFGLSFSETAGFLSKDEATKAKARLAEWVDAQGPRWKAEADACIAKHGLVVYGDEWTIAA
jgi:hypothetical protein